MGRRLLSSLCFASVISSCNDECKDSQLGTQWCDGDERVECTDRSGAEQISHNARRVLESCGARGLECIASDDGASWCGFSSVRCGDERARFCHGDWQLACRPGAEHPAALERCEEGAADGKFCVERAFDTVCSEFEAPCAAGEPPRCVGERQFECEEGAWVLAASTVCPHMDGGR